MNITKFIGYTIIIALIVLGCSSDDNSNEIAAPDTPTTNFSQANRQRTGSSANDLLSDSNFTSLRIEMISAAGFEPTETAINEFRSFIEARVFKPDGIIINQRSISPSNQAALSIDEIREIEDNNRTSFNSGNEIAVFVYFADAGSDRDTNQQQVLGVAYRNTSMVIYESTLRRKSTRPNGPLLSTLEAGVLNHEFAHLMGLVNVGTPLQSDHEDEENSGHCNVPQCLMQAVKQLESGMMSTGRVPQLDPQCIADLRANGGR